MLLKRIIEKSKAKMDDCSQDVSDVEPEFEEEFSGKKQTKKEEKIKKLDYRKKLKAESHEACFEQYFSIHFPVFKMQEIYSTDNTTLESYGIVPISVIYNISLYLDLKSIVKVLLTCKFFHRVVNSSKFWREYYKSYEMKYPSQKKRERGGKKELFYYVNHKWKCQKEPYVKVDLRSVYEKQRKEEPDRDFTNFEVPVGKGSTILNLQIIDGVSDMDLYRQHLEKLLNERKSDSILKVYAYWMEESTKKCYVVYEPFVLLPEYVRKNYKSNDDNWEVLNKLEQLHYISKGIKWFRDCQKNGVYFEIDPYNITYSLNDDHLKIVHLINKNSYKEYENYKKHWNCIDYSISDRFFLNPKEVEVKNHYNVRDIGTVTDFRYFSVYSFGYLCWWIYVQEDPFEGIMKHLNRKWLRKNAEFTKEKITGMKDLIPNLWCFQLEMINIPNFRECEVYRLASEYFTEHKEVKRIPGDLADLLFGCIDRKRENRPPDFEFLEAEIDLCVQEHVHCYCHP